jgi:hypothetical protein
MKAHEERGERTRRTTVAWDLAIGTAAVKGDSADPTHVILVVFVVPVHRCVSLNPSWLIRVRGGLEVPPPQRDGVVAVHGDLHSAFKGRSASAGSEV